MKQTSKLDFIIASGDLEVSAEIVHTNTSDHQAIMGNISCEIEENGDNGGSILSPRREGDKEMFFSGIINEIKEENVGVYLRYIMQVVSCIMNNEEGMKKNQQETFLEELKEEMQIVVVNKPRQIYQVEKKIDEMLKKRLPFEEINKEIAKLRKYSF